MESVIRKLSKIGVSEFILVFLLVVGLGGILALSSANVNFQMVILPPPPPTITAILGDPQTQAVLIIGSTKYPNVNVRVFAYSDPIFVETTTDSEGNFFAAFTADVLSPGSHSFTAAVVLKENKVTDSPPKVAVTVNQDYTVEPAAGSELPTVKIGNADPAASQLLQSIIRNQQAAARASADQLPSENKNASRARLIQIALFSIVLLESAILLYQRARRKRQEGRTFWHIGRGFYRLPPHHNIPHVSSEQRPHG